PGAAAVQRVGDDQERAQRGEDKNDSSEDELALGRREFHRRRATSGAAAGAARTGPVRPARHRGCRCPPPVSLPLVRPVPARRGARRGGAAGAWGPDRAPPGGELTPPGGGPGAPP